MIILPAIDIRGGKVVRLLQGDFTKETVYSGDPINMAIKWEKDGAKMLHIVDLDGAFLGKVKNLPIIKEITKSIKIPIELGGGLRSEEDVEKALSCGVKNVIIGTRAYKDESFLKRLVKKYSDAITIGVDASKGKVVADGWKTQTAIDAKDFVKKVEAIGVKTIIYTDISKDGMMEGPNLEAAKDLLDSTSCDVIISGGVSSLDDIKALRDLNKKNLLGAIVGKAFYEGAFTLKQANEMIDHPAS